MRILALEPYYGGSHQAFLDGWISHSRHEWTVLGLPPHSWKWRMHHAPATLATQTAERVSHGETWDAIFCSDMLSLATFRGLAPPTVRDLPALAYFHENQLTYPLLPAARVDHSFGFMNFTTCLAANQIWFNSDYNSTSFFSALEDLVRRMPDHNTTDAIEHVRKRSEIMPQGIHPISPRPTESSDAPLHILWAARWEHDKDPKTFFAALTELKKSGVSFQLSVIGQQFKKVPPIFAEARKQFREEIVRWGHQPTRADYENALREADVIVSTARHEFFGISVIEAADAGAFPLVPNALAYPELLDPKTNPDFFFDGTVKDLVANLSTLEDRHRGGDLWNGDRQRARRLALQYRWPKLALSFDEAIQEMDESEATGDTGKRRVRR